MKKYQIILETTALQEIELSYVWGREQWGADQARRWYQILKETIRSLSTLPERHPIAPEFEREELGDQIRQMVFQRYRILFTVRENKVHVLHVRGAYKSNESEEEAGVE